MELPSNVHVFWTEYLSQSGRDETTPLYDVLHFDDNQEGANQLARLVLGGKKRATASLLWEYNLVGRRHPREGDLSVVTDWDGSPLCVIETTQVDVRAFEDVAEDFAAAEGEGDLSLKYWRDAHWAYFGRVCGELKREKSLKMPIVCERLTVVFRRD